MVALLDTCGVYFSRGRAGARLDRFLAFFQAYCLSKLQPTPLDVDFDLQVSDPQMTPSAVPCQQPTQNAAR